MPNYKDKKNINHKSKDLDNLSEIYQICKKAYDSSQSNSTEVLRKELFEKYTENKKHHDNHKGCSGCETERETEKRICRCMYYYGKNQTVCNNCKLCRKWINEGSHKVTEYEVPTQYVLDGVGGMDLIIDDYYAAEVKPPKSKETLSRMIAETLTYTTGTRYKPAIAVFDGSYQWNALKSNYKKDDSLTEIIKKQYVTVFVIFYTEHQGIAKYKIKRFDEINNY